MFSGRCRVKRATLSGQPWYDRALLCHNVTSPGAGSARHPRFFTPRAEIFRGRALQDVRADRVYARFTWQESPAREIEGLPSAQGALTPQ